MTSKPDDLDAKGMGRRIFQARRQRGWTQRQLAEVLDVSERSMQAYERGDTVPWKQLPQLAQVFDQSLAWLMYGKDPEKDRAEQRRHREVMRRLDGIEEQLRVLTALAPGARLRSRRPS